MQSKQTVDHQEPHPQATVEFDIFRRYTGKHIQGIFCEGFEGQPRIGSGCGDVRPVATLGDNLGRIGLRRAMEAVLKGI